VKNTFQPPLSGASWFAQQRIAALLQVHIDAGAAQLVGSRQGQRTNPLRVGRREDDGLFSIIAGAHQRLPSRRVIAPPTHYVDPGIVGERRSGAEETNVVMPVRGICAGHGGHCLGLIDPRQAMPAAPPHY
jgi:hypothetical protein